MSKKVYLILFIILCFKGWGLGLVPTMSSSNWLILQVLFLIYGYLHWSRLEHNKFGKEYLGAFWCIVAGIVLSMIPAWLYYGQGIMTSIVAYRRQILWIAIPVLFRIAPSKDDVIGATKFITLVMWGVLLLRMYAPEFLKVSDDRLEQYQEANSYGYVIGFTLVIIPMYYSVAQALSDGFRDKKNILWIIICYAFLFAMQNRSILFASSVVILFTMLRTKSPQKPIIIIFALLFIGLFLFATSGVWMRLLNRTQMDLANEDYNRNVAYAYFLTEACTHFLQYVLGNGYISSHTSSLVEDLQLMGIFNSDVGFIGFWNEYGILPVGAFIYLSLLAMFAKNIPSYVGMMGLTTILCAPTLSYYGNIYHSLGFMLTYYITCYHIYQSQVEAESADVEMDKVIDENGKCNNCQLS